MHGELNIWHPFTFTDKHKDVMQLLWDILPDRWEWCRLCHERNIALEEWIDGYSIR